MKITKRIRNFKCNILDWHIPKMPTEFDGASYCSKCKYCDREILQDSQGNWFRLEDSWLVKKARELDKRRS